MFSPRIISSLSTTTPPAAIAPHRQLLALGHSQLADHEDIQRGAQRSCHFITQRYATSGQRKDHDIGAPPIMVEKSGQHPSGIPAAMKQAVGHVTPSGVGAYDQSAAALRLCRSREYRPTVVRTHCGLRRHRLVHQLLHGLPRNRVTHPMNA